MRVKDRWVAFHHSGRVTFLVPYTGQTGQFRSEEQAAQAHVGFRCRSLKPLKVLRKRLHDLCWARAEQRHFPNGEAVFDYSTPSMVWYQETRTDVDRRLG